MISYYVIPGLKNCHPKFNRSELSDHIIAKVCEYFDIKRWQLMERNRQREIVDARFISMYLLFNLTGLNKTRIAAIFNMDHTTVISALRKSRDLIITNDGFRAAVHIIESQLN